MSATFDEIGRNLLRGKTTTSINTEGEIPLHQKITDEIERNYRTIDLVGKHYSSIFAGVISLLGAIGLGILNINNFFSDWIIASNFFFVAIAIFTQINGKLSISKKNIPNNNQKKTTEKQKGIMELLFFDAVAFYQESVSRALGMIIFTNLLIILLFTGNIVEGNFSILQEDVSLFLLVIPAWMWFTIQAFSFCIIIWFFTSKKSLILSSLRKGLSFFHIISIPDKFTEMEVPIYINILFLISFTFFIISIIITINQFWTQISSFPLLIAIILFQGIIYTILCDFFSASIITRESFKKIYLLDNALTLIESREAKSNNKLIIVAEELYHTTRLLLPVKKDGWIFLSNYLFIPNTAYWRDEYEGLLIKYLQTVF